MPGIKQKMEMAEAESKKRMTHCESSLAHALTKLWGLGLLSARALQHLAACAVQDGLEADNLMKLASLGTWGTHKNNCHRDMLRNTCKDMSLKSYVLQVPDSKSDPPEVITQLHWLPPHQMVSQLATHYPQHLEEMFGLSKVKNFWLGIKPGDPRLHGSPVVEALKEQDTLIVPCFLHGDGVEFSSNDSLMTFSFGSMLGNSGLKQSQANDDDYTLAAFDKCFLIAAFPKSSTADKTWPEIFNAMCWSLKALWAGCWPGVDENGKRIGALAGQSLTPNQKVRFIIWNWLGDLEYFSNMLKYPHWNTDCFCPWCNASKSKPDKFIYDFAESPGWKLHSLEHQAAHPASPHLLVNEVPGCCSAYRILFDGLHTIELGLVARLAGSTLHGLVYSGGLNGEQTSNPKVAQKNLDSFWTELKECYRELHIDERLNNLKLSMFSNQQKPWAGPFVLKGHAGELKHLVPAMGLALQRLAQNGLRQSQSWVLHAAAAFVKLAEYYGALDEADIHMEGQQAAKIFACLKAALQHYSWLHQNFPFHQGEGLYFQLFPKLHFCYHIGWFAQYQNPRTSWCYFGESFVGRMATLAHSCAHGTRSVRLSHSFVEKYLRALHLRLTQCG